MSNFNCERCGALCCDSERGYVTGCEHYPPDIVRRRIVQANLCLRFYRSAGWTREDVRKLLRDDKRLARVMPRYFDERDKGGQGSFELDDGLPHDDCEYFAVYGACEPFDETKLAKHEIV
jgi:hypothetical protein